VDPAVSAVDFLRDPGDNRIDCKTMDPWTMLYACYSLGDNDDLGSVPDMQIMFALTDN
jgi:hypothetical protein